MTIEDFKLAKLRKETEAKNVSPRELIQLVAGDLDRGDYPDATKAIVIIIRESEGGMKLETYRSGLNRSEEIGHMEMWKANRLDDWRNK